MKSRLKYLAAGVSVAVIALLAGAGVTGASTSRAAGEKISPQAALDWNVIAVNTVRAAAPAKFQIEGNLYMSYVQAAVYDAVTTIKGRYVPYHVIGISAPGASPRAAVAAAAYTTLSYYFPAQAASLAATYTDYLNITLQALPAAAKSARARGTPNLLSHRPDGSAAEYAPADISEACACRPDSSRARSSVDA